MTELEFARWGGQGASPTAWTPNHFVTWVLRAGTPGLAQKSLHPKPSSPDPAAERATGGSDVR